MLSFDFCSSIQQPHYVLHLFSSCAKVNHNQTQFIYLLSDSVKVYNRHAPPTTVTNFNVYRKKWIIIQPIFLGCNSFFLMLSDFISTWTANNIFITKWTVAFIQKTTIFSFNGDCYHNLFIFFNELCKKKKSFIFHFFHLNFFPSLLWTFEWTISSHYKNTSATLMWIFENFPHCRTWQSWNAFDNDYSHCQYLSVAIIDLHYCF